MKLGTLTNMAEPSSDEEFVLTEAISMLFPAWTHEKEINHRQFMLIKKNVKQLDGYPGQQVALLIMRNAESEFETA